MVSTIEPDDIFVLPIMPKNLLKKEPNLICSNFSSLTHPSIVLSTNSLTLMLPLLFLQASLASAAILFTYFLLRHLGLPLMLAQILGGMLVGPSLLCRIPGVLDTIFPIRSFLIMDVVSNMGFMFYIFLIGVQTDIWMVKKITRKTIAIGFFTVAVPVTLTLCTSFVWIQFDKPSPLKIYKLPAMAEAESTITYPIVMYYLSELRVINSDIGKVAISSSMVSTLCSIVVLLSNIVWNQSKAEMFMFLQKICYGIIFAALLCFILGPLTFWEMKQALGGQPLKQGNMIVLFLAVLMSGFWGHSFGLPFYLGPFIFGLLIPSGPPLGSALEEKLDVITNWILMPLFFVKFGLAVDLFDISFKKYFRAQFFTLLAASGKFLGAFLCALRCQIPHRDAISLGFFMTFQGIMELLMFKILKRAQIIGAEVFAAMCLSAMLSTGVIAWVVRRFFDPSTRYVGYYGRSLVHTRSKSELRIVVCIHEEQNVPSAINVLATLDPCKQSTISIYMIHMVELMGRSTPPLLIPHKTERPSSRTEGSVPVINAFKTFEESQEGLFSVFPFVSASPPQTMHDSVCEIALEKGTSLIIIPFYKKFHVGGAVYLSKKSFRIANQNVLDKAPCSVAILVDRGTLKSLQALWSGWSSSDVAVIFLGGDDDREALALGARMTGRQNISLTLIRLLYDSDIPDEYKEQVRQDEESLAKFQSNLSADSCTKYIGEVVKDGADTATVLRTLVVHYDIIVVGRRHYEGSPFLSGLNKWNENQELGVIGDLLASSDFLGNTTILVVQQHTDNGHGKRNEMLTNKCPKFK